MHGREPRRRTAAEQGFALFLVLWILVLLSLLAAHIVAAGQREARLAGNLRTAAMLEAEADGALNEAIFHLIDASPRRWAADGLIRSIAVPHGVARIRIENLAGKVNPNTASPALLEALLRNLGTDPRAAAAAAAAILDWRMPGTLPRPNGAKAPQYLAAGLDYGPPGTRFETLDELGHVLGVTPEMLARLRPHLSLYQVGETDALLADPVVARSLADLGLGQQEDGRGDEGRPLTATITVVVADAHGGRFTRRAVVRIGGLQGGRGYQILAWDAPED